MSMAQEPKKNDGTDLKKNDGSSEKVGATDRTCYMQVVNQTGKIITNVAVTHSSGDTNTTITAPSMNNGDTTPTKQTSFETGFWADFDYWNASFSTGGSTYHTPYNDRCNISDSDEGQTIQLILGTNGPFGGDFNLKVAMPKSSDCNFKITKN